MGQDYLGKSIGLADGKMGMIIKERNKYGQWGVKVQGEDALRLVADAEIRDLGDDALLQIPTSHV